MGPEARREYLARMRERYVIANRKEKSRLLDEAVAVTGRYRKELWQHPAAPAELKKRILRTVLEEIVVNNIDEPSQHVLHVHWKGGVHTELRVARSGTGQQ